MVTAVDKKDRYTRRHSEDVNQYAQWIADELQLSAETTQRMWVGGLLHDIGKIGVPDKILRKPGRLSAAEWEVMKSHPSLGARMLHDVPHMEEIIDAVRHHHERWDGCGYPDGLVGEDIPLLSRILAVADAFSAMTTDRPYRKGMTWDAALGEIRAHSGTQFDPTLAHAFLAAAERRRPPHTRSPLPEAYPRQQASGS
jgi:putative nucleotidyltransferase with HDIG domain